MIRKFLVLDPLNLTGNISKNWENFSGQFTKFMKTAELYSKPEETKLAIFFNLIGKDALELFKTFKFCYQSGATNHSLMTLEMVMNRFKSYCDMHKNSVIYNSCKFQERKQLPGEDFDHYLKSICDLAKFCEFETEERMLRDRIISGVNDLKLQEELMMIPDTNLDNIVEHCRNFETRHTSELLLNEEEVRLFSYKIMKTKELNGDENNINTYFTIDLKDITQKEVIKKDSLPREEQDLPLNNNMENVQCVPTNSSYEDNISNSISEPEMDETVNFCQGDGVKQGRNVRTDDAVQLNPLCKLAEESLVQKEKCKIQWKDIFSYCQNNNNVNFMSDESDAGEEFGEVSFINECFNSGPSNDEIEKIQKKEDGNNKSNGIYSENIKHRLRKSSRRSSYKCKNCNEGFPEKDLLVAHEVIHCSGKQIKKEKEIKKENLKPIIKQETKDIKKIFKCYECGKIFTRAYNLKLHIMIHTGEMPFKCDICDKSFRQKTSLTAHLHTHLKDKPFKCDKCDKSFSYKSRLHDHLLTLHTKEKNFSCNECGKKYSTIKSLKNHSFAHTKPHVCSQCSKSFSQKFLLTRHLSVHKVKYENV